MNAGHTGATMDAQTVGENPRFYRATLDDILRFVIRYQYLSREHRGLPGVWMTPCRSRRYTCKPQVDYRSSGKCRVRQNCLE